MNETPMSETPQTPQEGIADALGDLSEQTRVLVRREVDAAQREMWAKAKAAAPALALTAASGALGLFAAAAVYRLSVRLLEKGLPPATAAFLAAVVYGAGAAGTAIVAIRQLGELPPLFPAETAQETGTIIAETAAETRG
jgi:Putative Actinobacterial Holin-X, holin superfamily III